MWLICAILGALWGGVSARRRGGNRLDMAQYACVGIVLGALLGLVLTIILDRLI